MKHIAPCLFPVGRQELTIPETAARLRSTEANVRKLIADGTLRAVDVGNGLGFWRVTFQEITTFEAAQKAPGARRAKMPQNVLKPVSGAGRSKNTPTPRQCAAVNPVAAGQTPQKHRSPLAARKPARKEPRG